MKLIDKQTVFNKGIMTSKLLARDDLEQYTQGLAEAENFVLSKFGPVTKRVGTKFINDLKTSGKKASLIPFVFSVDKSILLEVTNERIRFYTFDGEDFGQTTIKKLVTTDESATYSELYVNVNKIVSWGESDEKATLIYSDLSCTHLVGYIRYNTKKTETWNKWISNFYNRTITYNNKSFLLDALVLNKEEKIIALLDRENNRYYIKTPFRTIDAVIDSYNNYIVLLSEDRKIAYASCDPNTSIDSNLKFTIVSLPTKASSEKVSLLAGANTGSGYFVIAPVDNSNYIFISSNYGKTWTYKTYGEAGIRTYIHNPRSYTYDDSGKGVVDLVTKEGVIYSIYTYSLSDTLTGTTTNIFVFYDGATDSKDNYYVVKANEDYSGNISDNQLCIYKKDTKQLFWIKLKGFSYLDKVTKYLVQDIDEDEVNINTTTICGNLCTLWDNAKKIRQLYVITDTLDISYQINTNLDCLFIGYSNYMNTESYGNILTHALTTTGELIQLDKQYNTALYSAPETEYYICLSEEKPTSTDKEMEKYTYMVGDKVPYEYLFEEPLTDEQVDNISYVQSLDVLYLAFPDGKTPPKELRRHSDVSWELVEFVPEDGPYRQTNYDQSLTVSLSTHKIGEATITAKGFTFTQDDVNKNIRINWATYNKNTLAYEDHITWGKITSVADDGLTAKADMKVDNSAVQHTTYSGTTETTKALESIASTFTSYEWRLSEWGKDRGYPTKVTIHDQRLVWAGITDRPWAWLSNTFAFKLYSPSEYDGVISDSNSIYHDLSTDKISAIRWMKSVKNLIIGTEFEELRMLAAGPSLAPSDVAVLREASYGSHNAEPVITEDVIIFIQRLQRSLRALSYDYYRDAFLGPNLALLAEDLTLGGIKKVVYQKEPYSVLWVLKEDGSLLTCTYDKEQSVVGWTKCRLAGNAKVVDLITFPSSSVKQDSVAFIVEREINGETRRYMELLSREFLSDVNVSDIPFMDCSVRYRGSSTNTVGGLDHLIGQEVMVVEDGRIVADNVIVQQNSETGEGFIELSTEVKNAWIGLPYDAYIKTLERDFQDKQLSTHNAKTRIFKLYLTLIRTLGLSVQQLNKGEEYDLIVFNPDEDLTKPAVPVTDREELRIMSTWTNDEMRYSMKINSNKGLPCTIAGITVGIEINAL